MKMKMMLGLSLLLTTGCELEVEFKGLYPDENEEGQIESEIEDEGEEGEEGDEQEEDEDEWNDEDEDENEGEDEEHEDEEHEDEEESHEDEEGDDFEDEEDPFADIEDEECEEDGSEEDLDWAALEACENAFIECVESGETEETCDLVFDDCLSELAP